MSARVLIVVFDALRPEFVTPDLMPNLHAFAERGARFIRARSTYPTETRVNQSAVITGCMPRQHGITGNKFVADDLQPGLLVNSGDDNMLEKAFTAGPVLAMPTMGQRVSAAGRRFAALSAGTPGGGRLINWSAEQDDTVRLAMRRPDACAPADLFKQITDRIGPLPEYDLPAIAWITWAVDAYLAFIEKIVSPDAMLLWLCEPDESFHWTGIGSDASRETMAHVDAEFGRILDHHAPLIEAGEMNIIALSDHGQISLQGDRLDLADTMQAAGWSVKSSADPTGEAVLGLASAGGIWLPGVSKTRATELTEWLLQQPWCGPVFTRDGLAGTLPSKELFLDHTRAPDISLIFRANDDVNGAGIEGSTLHDAPYPQGGGCHGGLHKRELHTFLAMVGERVEPGPMDVPAGTIDVLPTAMAMIGLETPDDIAGRSLLDPNPGQWHDKVYEAHNTTGPRTHLSVTDLGRARYLNAAWAEG